MKEEKSKKQESRRLAFEDIYEEGYWGTDVKSGAGSTLEATKVTRQIISKVVQDFNITSIVDVACGDFTWMPVVLSELDGQVNYIGCDIVESLATGHQQKYPQYEFQYLDFVEGEIPQGDLILCRDVLQHLPVKDIKRALKNISNSGAKYLLATTHIRRHGFRNKRDIRPGKCSDRNLLEPPFNLPNPLIIYSEQYEGQDKFLGLWELPF
jgi:2-polyprenyl-3-methyl-5-hydroxy-6-metoxy-1,4-benzoquinol methylase